MNTIVWIMVMYGAGANVVAGPEFTSLEKCERAATVIKQRIDSESIANYRKPLCVRIEK